MLIECRFCLEEIEVEDPNLKNNNEDSDNLNFNSCCNYENSNNNSTDNFIEFIPINQNKRQRKNIGNRLVKPCDCKGTQTYVHVKCLCEWIGKCNRWYCSICHRVYNLSPHHLHYCVMRLQRKGVLKNLPPIYSNKEFSRSSYFALLIFMGTLSMLMLPSTLHQNNTYINKSSFTNSGGIDTTTSGYNPFNVPPTPYFSFYPSSSSPSIYFSNNGAVPSSSSLSSSSSSFFQPYHANNVLGVPHQNKVYEGAFQPYFNSNQPVSQIFSSCKLKNHDEKFSSFVCHSSPFVLTSSQNNQDSTNTGNGNSPQLTLQQQQLLQQQKIYSFNIPNENNNLNKVKEPPKSNSKQRHQSLSSPPQNKKILSYLTTSTEDDEPLLKNYNFIYNIQNYQPTTTTSTTTIKEISHQQEHPNQQPIITQTSKSPNINKEDLHLQNIYIARNNKNSFIKNIFCNIFPVRQLCF